MYKRFLLVYFCLFCTWVSLFSQYDGSVAVKDGIYKGYRMKNNQPDSEMTQVRQISLGNGVQVYMDADKQSYLSGTYYVFLGGSERLYGIAKFEKGLLHGEYLLYADNHLSRKMTYDRGLLEGKRYVYFEDGEEQSVANYKNGILQQTLVYHKTGQLKEKSFFDEFGLRHGSFILYDSNGEITKESNYQHGQLHGKSMTRTREGFQEILHYNEGILQGEYQLLFPNGQVKEEGHYDSQNERWGKWTTYNEDGSLQHITHYEKGELEGASITYYIGENMASYREYKKGKEDGKVQEYEENPHRLKLDATYKNGRLDGEYKAYNEGVIWRDCLYKEGSIISEKQYRNGQLVILRMMDESGRLVDVRRFDTSGKAVYTNEKYRKHETVRLVEDDFGIIDVNY